MVVDDKTLERDIQHYNALVEQYRGYEPGDPRRGELTLAVEEPAYLGKVVELVNAGVDVNFIVGTLEQTLLCHHAYNTCYHAKRMKADEEYAKRRWDIMDILLEAGADPNGRSPRRYTPLMNACWGFQEGVTEQRYVEKYGEILEQTIQRLLKAGANPDLNQRDGLGRTLHDIITTKVGCYGNVERILELFKVQEDPLTLLWIVEDNTGAIAKMMDVATQFFDSTIISNSERVSLNDDTRVCNKEDTVTVLSRYAETFGKIVVLMDRNLTNDENGLAFVGETLGEVARTREAGGEMPEVVLIYNTAGEVPTHTGGPVSMTIIQDIDILEGVPYWDGSISTGSAQELYGVVANAKPMSMNTVELVREIKNLKDSLGESGYVVTIAADSDGRLFTPKKDFSISAFGHNRNAKILASYGRNPKRPRLSGLKEILNERNQLARDGITTDAKKLTKRPVTPKPTAQRNNKRKIKR